MIRNTGAMALVVLALFLTPGCKKAPGPRAAFEGWLASIEKCEIPKIKAGMTSGSVEAIDKLTKQLKSFMPPDKAEGFDFFGGQICKGFKPGTIEIEGEDVTGETAMVHVSSEGRKRDIPMKIEDGKWKLDFQALIAGAMKAHGAPPAPKPAGDKAVKEPHAAPAAAAAPPESPADPPAKTR